MVWTVVNCTVSEKEGKLGVGPTSGVGFLLWFENPEKVVLSGVPIEASEPSGLESDSALFLRLIEDLFFFRGMEEDVAGLGVAGDMADTAGLAAGDGDPDCGMYD